MNIESSTVNRTSSNQTQSVQGQNTASSVKFSDELKELQKASGSEKSEEKDANANLKEISTEEAKNNEDSMDDAIESLNSVVEKLNQSDEKLNNKVKNKGDKADIETMINNDFNINENKDILPQMNPNMNFSGDGQPFSSFMNNENDRGYQSNQPEATAKNLAEEAAILSSMAENIAIANRNQQESLKTVMREDGIKKVDMHTHVTVENVVKFDSIIMNEADVEVFANLVQNGEINMNNLAPEAAQKSVQVSKTLADMLAKSMEENKPLRIDFDNDISVIIRISRDGKLSADFLPSSQVAEAYLKENLPLLKQRFDENNIDYDELNQRERRERQEDQNRKKDRKDE